MAFLHSVIGDNTIENREHLDKLGYEMQFVVSFVDFELIYTWKGRFYFIDKSDLEGIEMSLFINCIGNPQLFQAVSAITDDNDEDQWFTEGKEYIFCDRQDWIDMYSVLCSGGRYNYNKNGELDKFYKATLSELQAHFQRV